MAYTNRGRYNELNIVYRGATAPTTFYLALVTAAVAPGADTNTFSELTEIAAGNGYTTGGIAVARNGTDWDVLTEDDALDKAVLTMIAKVWTAAGGTLPASGTGARYAVLLDDNGTIASREVWMAWDLGSAIIVSDTQTLTVDNSTVEAA